MKTNVRGEMREISDAETEVRLSFNMKSDSGIWNNAYSYDLNFPPQCRSGGVFYEV